ncbi:MAG: methylated-DNA--[protein]-cysteine S-methyltransferase [Dehalococcoidia bacterium]
MKTHANAETFAAATDALRRGEPAGLLPPDADLVVAKRLQTTAPVLPDPAFAEALRAGLFVRLRRTAEVRYAPMEAPFGRIFVAYRDGKVVSASAARDGGAFERELARELNAQPVAEAEVPERLRWALLDHFEGRKRFEDVDLSWLRPFQRVVLEKTAEIPRGEVRPYGWVAREIGAPGATRAVGTALGRNPVPFIIPCHRVVRSDGGLGEYSGGGPDAKVRVLTYEGVPSEVLNAGSAPYYGSRTTHIFCYPTCRAARRIQPQHLVEFGSPAKALATGYRPCALCRPAVAVAS